MKSDVAYLEPVLDEVWRIIEDELPTPERAVREMLAAPPMEPAPKQSARGDA